MDSSSMSKYGIRNSESERQNESSSNDDQLKNAYNRYTPEQNQKLQEFYEQNSHPDESERSMLSTALGLDQERIKFWFQNYRSKTKRKLEDSLNQQLKEENEKLRSENEAKKLPLLTAYCEHCDEQSEQNSASRIQLLKDENAYMKEEVDKLNDMLAKYRGIGRSPPSHVENMVENQPTEEPSNLGSQIQ